MQSGMPTYMLGGGMFCALAAQKNHMALYFCGEVLDKFRPDLIKLHLNCGKGCLRFRPLEELPLELVATILEETAALRQTSA